MMTSLQPPEVTRWCMLAVSIVCFLMTMSMVRAVVKAEQTGVAYYSKNPGSALITERVTRDEEPAKFNQTIGASVLIGLIPGAVSVAAFCFYRRLSR